MNKEDQMPDENTPAEAGFFWAKKEKADRLFLYIVTIYGDSPYLEWQAWNLVNNTTSSGSGKPPFCFGPRIIEPEYLSTTEERNEESVY